MTSLIVGYGEIGKAVGRVIGVHDYVDLEDSSSTTTLGYDVLHVCMPYSENFLTEVENYIGLYSPKHIIIYSTVPIGTTGQIRGAVHSPVEGKHPELDTSIRLMPRWIGYNDQDEGEFFARFFSELAISTRLVPNSDFTEALKLLSTTEYGVSIEFARYKKYIAEALNMDYELMKRWNKDYNMLYQNLGMSHYQKFVLDAPDGPKGGHCVTPNAKLLHNQHPSDFTKIVGEL